MPPPPPKVKTCALWVPPQPSKSREENTHFGCCPHTGPSRWTALAEQGDVRRELWPDWRRAGACATALRTSLRRRRRGRPSSTTEVRGTKRFSRFEVPISAILNNKLVLVSPPQSKFCSMSYSEFEFSCDHPHTNVFFAKFFLAKNCSECSTFTKLDAEEQCHIVSESRPVNRRTNCLKTKIRILHAGCG